MYQRMRQLIWPNPCNYFHSVDRQFMPNHTRQILTQWKGQNLKRPAQGQAQARPKVRPLVLGVDLARRAANGPWRSNALKRGDKCLAAKVKKIAGKARLKKTDWRRTGRARSKRWSRPHESPQRDRHGGGQHLGSEAAHVALALHAPQVHQILQRPATANPCTELKTL